MRRCLKEIIEKMGFEEHFNEFTADFEDERSGDIMEVIVKEDADENGIELLEFHLFDEGGNFRGKYYLDQMIVAADVNFKLHSSRDISMLIVKGSGYHADNLEITISRRNRVLFQKKYYYGYDVSYSKDFANEFKPLDEEIVRKLREEYKPNHIEYKEEENHV